MQASAEKARNQEKETGKEKMTSLWLIGAVGICYGIVAIEQAIRGNYALSVIWGGYCFSQWGLLWITLYGGK